MDSNVEMSNTQSGHSENGLTFKCDYLDKFVFALQGRLWQYEMMFTDDMSAILYPEKKMILTFTGYRNV